MRKHSAYLRASVISMIVGILFPLAIDTKAQDFAFRSAQGSIIRLNGLRLSAFALSWHKGGLDWL